MIYHHVPPINTPNKANLVYWEDFLTAEELDLILTLPEWGALEEGKINPKSGITGTLDAEIRKSQIGWVLPTEHSAFLWEKISKLIANINAQFFNFDISGIYEPMQLTQYKGEEQGRYNWHPDMSMNQSGVMRKLSMVLSLSDPSEFTGGELQLKDKDDEPTTVELAKGRAWFFPSWVLHRVAPVTSGVRKSLVVWAGGPPFR